MSINFSQAQCQSITNIKLFGLCDDPPPNSNPAYIDSVDGAKWIAVVVNDYNYPITFTAIDNCITILRPDGKMAQRCDGMLSYNSTVIFVELKERAQLGSDWIKDAEGQLRTTIGYFEASAEAANFSVKKAYAANSEHPKFRTNQIQRMEAFFEDTGYVFRIENRIIIE
jgi:hypothetical protein